VVEAHQAETPLLILTADRPPRLRGADSNQTIEQVGIFGSYLRLFAELSPAHLSEATLRHLRSLASRAVARAIGDPAGAVHLNLPFDIPLEPAPVEGDLPEALARGDSLGSGGRPNGIPWTVHLARRLPPTEEAVALTASALARAKRPLLVAGVLPRPWEAGPLLRRAAAELGLPLLADPLSGARYPIVSRTEDDDVAGVAADLAEAAHGMGRKVGVVVGGYDLLLRDPELREKLRPDLILRVGAAPVSALLTDWLAEMDRVPHILVDGGDRWKDHTGSSTLFIPADPGIFLQTLAASASPSQEEHHGVSEIDSGWLAEWKRAECSVAESVSRSLGAASSSSFVEGMIAVELARQIPDDELLFVSNSMPVRDLDTFVTRRDRGLLVLGNRGASGIDGIVSTAVGASLATGKRVTALVGDLALLHDSNGLASLREVDARVLLVVVNNDGGGIFHFLPIRDQEPAFTSLFATPHGRDLRHLADLHALDYRRADLRTKASPGGADELEVLRVGLREAYLGGGSQIFEVLTDRGENRERRSRLVHEIAAAARQLTT
jgi:2-succinyl-5-enolpyruvyl-6-hydroxy-3-cyclohexene-1-carboxylate synthase